MWTALWIVWIGIFLVLEGIALFDKTPGNTLSERTWDWFSVRGRGRAWRLRRFVLLSFMAWLAVHFLTGGAFI